MKELLSKITICMYYAVILLTMSGFVLSCVSTPDPSSTTTAEEPAASVVRKPPGDPEVFWDSLAWTELTLAEQKLWNVLGWDEPSWEGEAKKPASEDKYWRQLNDEERTAAGKLGYNKKLWD